MKDHDYVNFSEDYELNYRLRQVEKRQTEGNRIVLKTMGNELKLKLDKPRIQHGEFHNYISQVRNLLRLES
ncbi:hypothetical protein [Vibrio brasiliensis]|uniref:hypothetical protein n=1 Tax=Vibrio brasiliensis TaxID=170652 RepID=UPI001EFC8FB7|nr:hypothetical protein [Vibrio brasiliensis]MCG9727167.1 hypothetical protein [Vibrio brasiliensis]